MPVLLICFVICPKNKPFLAETLNAGKGSGGATRDWNYCVKTALFE
jgi:hypothetical protein